MSKSIKILLVDDDEEDFIITRDIVNDINHRKYEIQWVSDFNKGVEVINQKKHNVYLIDYKLGPDNGLDLIKAVVKNGCKAPLILLTGQEDLETDEEAMKAGASDYLIKGNISPRELERSIRYSIQNSKNIEEIQKLNIGLEEKVRERTSELSDAVKKLEEINIRQKKAEDEVRKALEKEKQLNELKSRFVTIASHEFRTPLTTILSSVSLISRYIEAGESEKGKKHIQRIKSSVTNLTGILNDFLSLSKLEEGILTNNPSEFNLKLLAEEVREEMHALLKENQRIHYEHTGTETVFLDKQITKNILVNLTSNAIKYSEQGTISIKSDINQSGIKISVKDEGIGIPEEDKPFLFSRFFRAANAGNIQGTGLGLNIVKRYSELLNGKLEFESELGKGTLFKLEISTNHENHSPNRRQ